MGADRPGARRRDRLHLVRADDPLGELDGVALESALERRIVTQKEQHCGVAGAGFASECVEVAAGKRRDPTPVVTESFGQPGWCGDGRLVASDESPCEDGAGPGGGGGFRRGERSAPTNPTSREDVCADAPRDEWYVLHVSQG